MRLVIKRPSSLIWIQYILLVSGLSTLGYCAYSVTDSWLYQQQQSKHLNLLLAGDQGAPGIALPTGAIGRLQIERLGISVMVVEGTGTEALRHAAGHIAGTAQPGEAGNVGISAHRDTFFRPLRNVRRNDIIIITTAAEEFTYSVVSTQIVRPTDIAVLNPTSHEVLTLVTCYPFYFIGSAPDRFIVRADRVSGPASKTRSHVRNL